MGNMQTEICPSYRRFAASGIDMSGIDRMLADHDDDGVGPEVATAFGIADALAREIMWANDDAVVGTTKLMNITSACCVGSKTGYKCAL